MLYNHRLACDNYKNQGNALCWQNAEMFNVKRGSTYRNHFALKG